MWVQHHFAFTRSADLAYIIPYSQKYWQEFNLAVEPKIVIARILAGLNLAVRYGIAIRIIYYMQVGNLGGF